MTRLFSAAALGLALVATPALAQNDRVELGLLDCNVAGGAGFIFGSSKALACTFTPSNGPAETYSGSVDKFGLDIGFTNASVIKWVVLAPTNAPYQPGALAGSYGGVSGEATVGVGLGANALVGGSNQTIVLQPFSVTGQEGLNVALGIASINLNAN